MSDSLQKWVGRNRPPRVQITYDVEIGDAIESRELPLVVGIMADLYGQPLVPPPKLKERRFIEIDRDNFDGVMGKIAPRLDMSVPDTLKGEGNLKVELNFIEFADFQPEAIVKQVPRLSKLLEARNQLRDLLSKLDGNDELDLLLEDIIQNAEQLQEIKGAAPSDAAAGASPEGEASSENA
ncbi:type VI secretion system contractile sheath small subunit [Burkholderiaceae bacterium]|jgi:type VI secretion system protein ImpB|nr:type VI secretion system contractile sheath small subunit [Burkholderiaceae bacterium]|tara:strand:- start:4498 stop:5040 length:543 start_codon:yes stop_codon:yes gene_type:complete